ncbi:hypothetical protein NPX13_g4510 [Xylaria arbuscula]|uniref:ASX DEUBAD domain-containing protein n=1 Tax=Xylaria arbuscula TaxID=114810 RepID=A0A9W8NGN8_9PEZI|nr:hypothetical protein NPX13_g4510 [Xylaria arbuscula]
MDLRRVLDKGTLPSPSMPEANGDAVTNGHASSSHAVESISRSLRRSRRIASAENGEEDESSPWAPKKQRIDLSHVVGLSYQIIKGGRSKYDNPDEMLTNPNSPLVKAKLRELLCSPMAWDILSKKEKEQVISKFPARSVILDRNASRVWEVHPDVTALLNNNNFRNDVARYQEGLKKGCHEPDWILGAQAAHKARSAGVYDEFLAADFEERWGMPMPELPLASSQQNGSEHQAESAPRQSIEPEEVENGELHQSFRDSPGPSSTGSRTRDPDDDDDDDERGAPRENLGRKQQIAEMVAVPVPDSGYMRLLPPVPDA